MGNETVQLVFDFVDAISWLDFTLGAIAIGVITWLVGAFIKAGTAIDSDESRRLSRAVREDRDDFS